MAKSKYTRTTRECTFAGLRPEIAAAMRAFAAQREIANLETKVLHCFEVTAIRKGFFGKVITEHTGLVLIDGWMIWGMCGKKGGPWARGVRRQDILEVRDYEKTEMFAVLEEHGLEIHGTIFGNSHRSTWFLGLGTGVAADEVRRLLKEASGNREGA